MNGPSNETLFLRFRRAGDARALGSVFDATAGELARVAGYLAGGDPHAAGDLLQATWLTAIERAGTWDERRPVLPWLLGILANHARGLRRKQRRETTATADTDPLTTVLAGDDPVRDSADAEFQRLCAAALDQLPSPFREVVALHVQHGLTAKEIAAALGRPAGTVRTQIVRGLDRLRERLPASIAAGSVAVALGAAQLARIRAALLERAQQAVPTATASISVLSVAATVLVVVAMLVVPHKEQPRPTAAAAQRPDPVRAEVPALATDVVRERVAELAPQDPAPVAPQRPRRRLTVHVRHAGEPQLVAGEWVALHAGDELRLVATDANGDAVFEHVEPALSHHVFLSGSGASAAVHAPSLPPPDTFDLATTIDVAPGESLHVRVVDSDRKPIAGAEVEGNAAQGPGRNWLPLGRTDERGELVLRDQRVQQYRARAAGHAASSFVDASADGTGGHRCELVLGSATTALRGRIVDENGEPVPAELGIVLFGNELVEPWFDRTDARGEFTLDWLTEGHVAIVARAQTRSGSRIALVRTDAPRSEPLEIRLGHGAGIDVTARLADDAPATEEMVRARLLAPGTFAMPFGERSGRTDRRGRLRFDGLVPGRWHVEVDLGGTRTSTVLELAAGADAQWTTHAPTLRELPVRLLDQRGEPLSGWRVQPFDLRNRALGQPAFTLDDGCPPPFQVHRLPPDEPIALWVFDPEGYERGPWFPVQRVPGVLATGERVDVRVQDHCRSRHFVRGRLVDDQGSPLAATVRVLAPRAHQRHGFEVSTDGNGAFRVGPFPPGRLQGVVERAGAPVHWLPPLDVPREGDLDLGEFVLTPGVEVQVVVATDGSTPTGVQLRLLREPDGRAFALRRREPAVFAATGIGPGRYRVEGSSLSHAVQGSTIEVGREAVQVTLRCAAAPTLRLELPLLDDEAAQMMWSGTVTLRRGNDVVLRRSHSVRFHGRVPQPLPIELAVPPGRYAVEVEFFDVRRALGEGLVLDGGATLRLVRG